MPCNTADCVAIQKIVKAWMDSHVPDISFSVLEDPDKLGVAVRLYIPGDLRQKTFEQVDQNEIVGWLGAQPISK
jgi:hypothetical protein